MSKGRAPTPVVLSIALSLAEEILKVFFLSRRKTPMKGSHGYLDATNKRDELIALYWRHHEYGPPSYVAYATGPIGAGGNGVAVLDLDFKHPEAIAWWETNKHRLHTRTYRTRSGGLHLVFLDHPKLRTVAGAIETGVDVKAKGGYAAAWWAHGYEIVNNAPITPWPDWLDIPPDKAVTRRQQSQSASFRPRVDLPPLTRALLGGLSDLCERPTGIKEGERDDTLMRYAGHCLGIGTTPEQTLADCLACNATFDPPMTEAQVLKIVNSIARKEAAKRAQFRADKQFLIDMYREA
ncbi:MAG TPA: bifunctional DNA primase/polymerase [Xanthobacteraceae bacterium]|nr:bifunctional DNA primase/polymerase [Xanthobacteraceae bacterium]